MIALRGVKKGDRASLVKLDRIVIRFPLFTTTAHQSYGQHLRTTFSDQYLW